MIKTTFGKKLCDALGLDPADVFSIKLESAVHEVDTLTIGQYADADKYNELGEVFKKFKIVPIDNDAPPPPLAPSKDTGTGA